MEAIEDPSIWILLLGDRSTIGFVRLALVVGSLFLIASVVAWSISANWMRAFGRFNVGEAETADEALARMQGQLLQTQVELEDERRKRLEAEEIADDLSEEMDAVLAELESCQEELSSGKWVEAE